MIWATVISWSCFCWLYRASPSLAAKNIISRIWVLTIWWCPCVESSLVLLEEGVCYDQCIFLAKLYSLLCFILYSKAKFACYSRCFLTSYFCIPVHARGATHDGWVMVERPDRMWSTGEGNGKPLQYSCLENPMNSIKRQNDRILKEELPRSVGAQYATGDQWRNNSRNNEGMEPKQKQYSVVWLVIEARSDAIKSNSA